MKLSLEEKAFGSALERAYRGLADQARAKDDVTGATLYAMRADLTASGGMRRPTEIVPARLGREQAESAYSVRKSIANHFVDGARRAAPEVSARAYANYDCWITELTRKTDDGLASACQGALGTAVAQLDGVSAIYADAAPFDPAAPVERGLAYVPRMTPPAAPQLALATPADAPVIASDAAIDLAVPGAAEVALYAAAPTRDIPAPVMNFPTMPSTDAGGSAASPSHGWTTSVVAGLEARRASHAASRPVRVASLAPDAAALAPGREKEDERVYFGFDSAALTREAKQALRELAAAVRTLGASKVSINGYTDRVGARAYNDRLAGRRARAAADYLAGLLHGIVFKIASLGESDPARPTADGVAEAYNRRVEIKIE